MKPLDIVNNPEDTAIAKGKIYRVDRFVLHAEQWQAFKAPVPLPVTWKKIRYIKSEMKKLPKTEHGIYTFVAKPHIASHPACAYLLYVGKADKTSFAERCPTYMREEEQKKPRQHIVHMVKRLHKFLWLYYTPVADQTKIAAFEDKLIAALIPPFNRAWPAKVRPWVKGIFS